ncbi:MAG TPA: helix-turn-helix domain-containing protein [Candidatus Ornithomonoglobus merdipullorum]|mgnify:FL=1|uniref:Helix-turn-helix domain-containing protein n=1 Tax=Candidatus Ornithomonoglobus merdipullorum TaxID=2840895 RepID=A0A9D1MBG6_9FIRM|nr:helix-turn-helix domain-containing protein [Candidatus Ornithomonoglobus merdipullorum]
MLLSFLSLSRGMLYIPEIAKSSGFSSSKTFGAAFKKEFGMTPGEYRDMHRGKPLPKSVQYRPTWQPLYAVNARRHEGKLLIDHFSVPPSAYRLHICTGGSALVKVEDGSAHMLRRGDMFLNKENDLYSEGVYSFLHYI